MDLLSRLRSIIVSSFIHQMRLTSAVRSLLGSRDQEFFIFYFIFFVITGKLPSSGAPRVAKARGAEQSAATAGESLQSPLRFLSQMATQGALQATPEALALTAS